jgi:hypothetical protein
MVRRTTVFQAIWALDGLGAIASSILHEAQRELSMKSPTSFDEELLNGRHLSHHAHFIKHLLDFTAIDGVHDD